MNILISKMMTARFTTISEREKMFSGFDTITYLFQRMAEAYPQHTFWYAGSSDLYVENKSLPPNLKDLNTPMKKWAKANGYYPANCSLPLEKVDKTKTYYRAAVEYCKQNNLQFDLAIIHYEQHIPLAHWAEGYVSSKTGRVLKTLCSQRTPSHVLALTSDLDIPTYMIIDDPRELNHQPPDIKPPVKIFSQKNGFDISNYYTDLVNKVSKQVPLEYAHIEKVYLLKKERVDFSNIDDISPTPFETYKKDNEFIMALNGNPDRLEFVRKYLFKRRPDMKIFGKWLYGELGKKIEDLGLTSNFIEKPMSEMEDVMWRTKYTLVPPVKANAADFVTQKVYSMIYYGIVPFWIKGTYDTGNIFTELPDYIKVESEEELWDKIDELNNDPEKYKALVKTLYDALKPEYFTNDFIKQVFGSILE